MDTSFHANPTPASETLTADQGWVRGSRKRAARAAVGGTIMTGPVLKNRAKSASISIYKIFHFRPRRRCSTALVQYATEDHTRPERRLVPPYPLSVTDRLVRCASDVAFHLMSIRYSVDRSIPRIRAVSLRDPRHCSSVVRTWARTTSSSVPPGAVTRPVSDRDGLALICDDLEVVS